LKLTLFDLDHTLLSGDTDALWCEFLLREGLLPAADFAQRSRDIEQRYRAGSVSAQEFCDFYVGTLAGRSAAQWEPIRRRFVEQAVLPRIPAAAVALVERHRVARDLLVLTTATNRFLTEPTARHLGFEHVIATEAE
jgi:phosphoserine phosphatase